MSEDNKTSFSQNFPWVAETKTLIELAAVQYQPILETEGEHKETQSERHDYITHADSHLIPFKQALIDCDATWQEEGVFHAVWALIRGKLDGKERFHLGLLPRPRESLELIENLKPGDKIPDRNLLWEIFIPVFHGDRGMTNHLLDAWDESMKQLEERNLQQEERVQFEGIP